MISVLEVKNFQAWKHATLEFCNGVNIIKGTSNFGKSSLIRAFDWAFNNRPVNDEMRPWSDEKKKLDVVSGVGFDDESFITRIKGRKSNGYESSVGDMEAMGHDVPLEIKALANMSENLHRQDDGYFLLNDTPGSVARVLNRKSGLEDIDIIQKATKGLLSELQSELKRNTQNRDGLQAELETLAQVCGLKPRFDKLRKMIADFNEMGEFKTTLTRHLQNIKAVDIEIADLEHSVSKEKQIAGISKLLRETAEMESRANALSSLIETIEYHESRVKKIEGFVSINEKIIDIRDKLTYMETIKAKREEIRSLLADIHLKKNRIKFHEDKLKYLEPKKIELEKQLEFCPTCGSHKKHWRKG